METTEAWRGGERGEGPRSRSSRDMDNFIGWIRVCLGHKVVGAPILYAVISASFLRGFVREEVGNRDRSAVRLGGRGCATFIFSPNPSSPATIVRYSK